jgi:hypothetical protein
MANEFRYRFALYGGSTLNLLVEVGIQAEASHPYNVSQQSRFVIHRFDSLTFIAAETWPSQHQRLPIA